MNEPRNKTSPAGQFPGKALNASVGAYYRSIRNRIFLREAAAYCAASLFLGGGIALFWRLAIPGARRLPMILLSIGLVIAAAATAMYRTTRLAPSKRRLVVWLDARIGGGGFLASSLETDCSAWADRIRVPQKPGRLLKFSAASLLALFTASRLLALLAGAVFLPAALLVDTGRADKDFDLLDTREEIENLKKDIEVLEREPLIRKEEVAEIREALEKIQAESKSTDPARTFEALDAIRDQIKMHAGNAVLSMARSEENMKRLSQAASMLSKLPEGSREQIKGAEQLMKLAEKLAEDDSMLKDFLKDNADLVSNLKPEDLLALAGKMDLRSTDLQKDINALNQILREQMPQLSGGAPGTGPLGDPAFAPQELMQWLQDNAPGANELVEAAYRNAGQGNKPEPQDDTQNTGKTGGQGNPGAGQGDGQGDGPSGSGSESGSGPDGNSTGGSSDGGQGNPPVAGNGNGQVIPTGGLSSEGVPAQQGGADVKLSGDAQKDPALPRNRPVLVLKPGSNDGRGNTISEKKIDPLEQDPEDAKAGQLDASGKAAHSETRILPSHRESVRRYTESVHKRYGDSPDQP